MIDITLHIIVEKLNEFLSGFYNRPEIIAEEGVINTPANEEEGDKIILSLLSIERETAMGINSAYKNTGGNTFNRQSPPWHINLNIVIAAVFSEKRYADSLKILSDSLSFLQQNSPIDLPGGQKITIELLTLSFQELSNVWSMLGGHYYPSVVCKVRMLTFDGNEIRTTTSKVKDTHIN